MKDWYSGMYKGLILAGIIAFIIGTFSSGSVSMDAYIAGYSALILGIMLILMILIYGVSKKSTQGQTTLQMLFAILSTTGPFILLLGVIAFILYLLIKYRTPIIEDHVSYGYYTFSTINVILILIQLYIVYKNISTPLFEETGRISSVQTNMIYLIGLFTAISTVNLYIILKYFRTDGFRSGGSP